MPEWVQKELKNFDFTQFAEIEQEIIERKVKKYFDTTDLLNGI